MGCQTILGVPFLCFIAFLWPQFPDLIPLPPQCVSMVENHFIRLYIYPQIATGFCLERLIFVPNPQKSGTESTNTILFQKGWERGPDNLYKKIPWDILPRKTPKYRGMCRYYFSAPHPWQIPVFFCPFCCTKKYVLGYILWLTKRLEPPNLLKSSLRLTWTLPE